jgi:hypothetical protein
MPLVRILKETLSDLGFVIGQLTKAEYSKELTVLSGATIGQHTRHVIEMVQCLIAGYDEARFSYDDRKRDISIESDPDWALSQLNVAMSSAFQSNKLMIGFHQFADESVSVDTNYYRELIHNIDHTIHHCAIIRIGLMSFDHVIIPEGFGIAPSTIRHRSLSSCAS